MSQKLFESDFVVMNPAMWRDTEDANNSTPDNNTKTNNTAEGFPQKGEWQKWGKWLDDELTENKKLSPAAQVAEKDIYDNFFKNFYQVNWENGGEYLLASPELRTYFVRRNVVYLPAFNPEQSPLLSFLSQDFVKNDLIAKGWINKDTIKALLKAYVEKLVSWEDFKNKKSYNIIYCKDLYNKTAAVMVKYLMLQNRVLANTDVKFTPQDKNRLVFLKTSAVSEFEPIARAEALQKLKVLPKDINDVENCELNNLELAQLIANKETETTSKLNSEGQDTLVSKLKQPADMFAAILALALTTDSAEAKKEINNKIFNSLSTDQKYNATVQLTIKGIMPKGRLNKADADALVKKIIAVANKTLT